ncbi:MAG: HAD-IA family hydrolase [Candidatus Omnitrophica bacterium]|nr:HAD-IA family hydrolase [Candidatus Omnitrophota bacterium]
MTKIRLNVHAIILDMDGVITNTMPDHFRSWKVILKRIGIPVTHYDVYRREGQPGIHSVRELTAQYGKPIADGQAHKILKGKEAYFKKIVRLRFILGARTFLKRLHKNNFRLALVTGTSRHETCRILPASLRRLFSVIVTGSDVKHGKPHPEPYLQSLKKLGLKTGEAVVIENAPFGIQSAKRAGLRCLALETSLPRKYLKEADAVFGSIKELSDGVCFNNLNGRK